MMTTQFTYLQDWVKARNLRERVLLVIIGWTVIYMLWFLLLVRPLNLDITFLNNQVTSLLTQTSAIHDEAAKIVEIATRNSTNSLLKQNKALSNKTEDLRTHIEFLASRVIPMNKVHTVLKDILNQPGVNTQLINLKNQSEEPLLPNQPNALDTLPLMRKIKKHYFEVQLRSNYFSTISYLQNLEKLPWSLYWNSLEYKVVDYPQADVSVKFYILTN